MGGPAYTEEFLRARRRLRRGQCPTERDLKHVYDQGWDSHLGASEKELAEKCKQEYATGEE